MKTVVSLFSGCGGLDLGFEGGFSVHKDSVNKKTKSTWVQLPKNDFKVIFANDIMPQAKKVWQANFSGEYHLESIVNILAKNISLPKADVVIGGFPCQDFSVAGKRKGFSTERGTLYRSMVDVVRKIRPKVFVAENVYGLLSIQGAKERIMQDFEREGYRVYCFAMSAADYGVPQKRKRIFFVGLLKHALRSQPTLDDIKPQPTHTKPVAVGEIFADLEEPDVTQDMAQRSYSKAKFYGAKCQGNTEINLFDAAPTMRAEHHGNIEFRRLSKEHGGVKDAELAQNLMERRLTVRECARIQTFPDDFNVMVDVAGNKIISASHAYRVLGNAVPPLLGYHVANRIDNLWNRFL